MVWSLRCNEKSLQKLDKDLKRKINGPGSGPMRRKLLEKLRSAELLNCMPEVYIGIREEIIQRERVEGRRSAAGMFLDKVTCYNGWGLAFLDALHATGFKDLAESLRPDYSPPPSSDIDSDDDNDNNTRNDDSPPPYSEADPIAPSERDITPNNILDPPQKKDENETIPKIPYSSPQAIWMRDQEEEERKFALQSTVPNFNSTRKSAGDRSQLQHPQSSPKTFVTADATAEFSKKEQAVPVKCPGEPKMQHTSTSLTSSALVPSASQNKTSTDHGDSAVSRSSSSTSTSSGSNSVPDELDLQRESRMNILEDNVHMNIRSNSAGTTSFNYPTTSQFQSSIIQVCNPHRSTALFDDKSPMLESLNDNFKTASLRNSSLKEEMKLKSSEKNDETESLTDSQIQESDTDTEVESVGEKSKQECRSVKDDIAKSKNESKLTKQEPKDGIFSFPDEGEVLISDQNEENVSTSCLNSSTNQATVIESDSKDIRNQIAASESTTNVPQKLHRRLPNQIEAKRSNTIDTQNRSSAPTNSFSLSTETTNKTHATVAQNSLQNHVDASSLAANVGESIQNEFSPSNDPDVAIHIHDNSQQSDNDAGNPLRQVMRTALTAGFWVVDTYNKYAKFLN